MKNASYFTSKALFVLKIFIFLFWLFAYLVKQLDYKDKVNLKIYDVTAWLINTCNTHIAQYLEKENESDNEIWSVNKLYINNILKLSCRPFAYTSYYLIFPIIFKEKYLLCYSLYIDQVSLSGCFSFLRHSAICVLQLFVKQVVTSWILNLTLYFHSSCYSAWPKSHDKRLNILKTKMAFKMK